MGTTTKAPVKKAKAKAKAKVSGNKYSPEMKAMIVAEIKKADKAGTTRAAVYARLAEKWTAQHGVEFKPRDVASTFHFYKKSLGYTKNRAPAASIAAQKKAMKQRQANKKRAATIAAKKAAKAAPKAKPTPAPKPAPAPVVEAVEVPESNITVIVSNLTSAIETLQEDLAAERKRAAAAEAAVARIRKAVG